MSRRVTAKSLSPQEQIDLKVKYLHVSCNRAVGDFQFKKITTWLDFFHTQGLPRDTPIPASDFTIAAIKQWFSERIEEAKAGKSSKQVVVQQTEILPSDPHDIVLQLKPAEEIRKLKSLYENPLIRVMPFQNRAAVNLLDGILIHHKPAQLLQAPVGTGKTFMLGAVIKELWDSQWEPLLKSLSPCPILYLTRATIVEQTERVLRDKFGIVIGEQVVVTNIDQMRSRYGETLVEEKSIVRWNEIHIIYRWRPRSAPVILILDESQGVKNDEASQTKIISAFNEIEDDRVEHYSIHSSATPFTRVSEARVFAVATKLKWN